MDDVTDQSQFLRDVRAMRRWQRVFFKTRDRTAMANAQQLERCVDSQLAKFAAAETQQAGQLELFAEPGSTHE